MRRLSLILVPLLAAGELSAQAKKGRCSGEVPDSAWLAAGPVYRDCEVDRKAELRGAEPRLPYTPPAAMSSDRCYSAELEFVVDVAGVPELETVRARPANDRDMEEAMRAVLPMRRYLPARLDGQPVRQLVVYRSAVSVVRVVTSGGRPTMPVTTRRGRSC